MATAYGYYEDTETGEELCFKCAVKRAINADADIAMCFDSYESHQCKACGAFTHDKVLI